MITLKTYLEDLNALIELQPEILDFPVVYFSDDEGNDLLPVIATPSLIKVADLNVRYLETLDYDSEIGHFVIALN